jgi:hypothetical protein
MKLTSIFSNKYSRYAFFVGIVLFSIILWIRFTYPLFSHIDLSVSRQKAIDIATRYVESRAKLDINHFKRAVIFDTDSQTDRYLQKAIGFESGNKFLQEHHYDLFYWTIRFFNEGKKEEYRVVVSSRTGEVISLNHILEESTERKEISELEAQEKVRLFLEQTFHYDFRDWSIQSKSINKYDHRIEYLITWERKNIYVPWDADPKKGGAKLLTMATVTGDEIIGFSKQYFYVPDEFRRYIERKKESGRNLGLVSNMGSLAFMIGAIWMVVYRRNHLSMNSTKKFYIKIIGFLFLLSLLSACNNSQAYVFSYPTTQPYIPFLIRQALNEILERFFFFMAFIIPCLAGELLRFEVNTKNVRMSFFHYISTTLFSRDVAKTILFGYCFAIVMIGLQTLVFEFGYNFCDVWVEQNRLSRFSTAFLPFFGI